MCKNLLTALLIAIAASVAYAEESVVKAGEQIVAIGDSITQAGGYLRNIDTVFAKQYPDLKIPKVMNAGIGGQKAEDLVGRFERDVLAKKPAIVTIDIGINDVWHRLKNAPDENVLQAYKANVGKMVEAAQAAGIRVVLCTPTVIQEDVQSEGNKRLTLYCDAVKQLAVENKCALADLHGAFLQAIAKKPAELKGNSLTSDGVHMNAAGDWLMAEGILLALGIPADKIEAAKQ